MDSGSDNGSSAFSKEKGEDTESHPIWGRDGMERERELIQLAMKRGLSKKDVLIK